MHPHAHFFIALVNNLPASAHSRLQVSSAPICIFVRMQSDANARDNEHVDE